MQDKTVQILQALNRRFYDDFAAVFAHSRGRSEPGLDRVLAQVIPGSRVLDLGCGHGRVVSLLPEGCTYVGLDFSPEMLDIARANAVEADCQPHFVASDLLSPQWLDQVRLYAPAYDWILLRAVLHHIPGYTNRQRILEQVSELLAVGGYAMMANWQFLEIPRLRRRICSWREIGLQTSDVEPGDYLLDWQREGRGLRYVHLVDEAESRQLAKDAGLEIVSIFRADGHTNNLTIYAVLT